MMNKTKADFSPAGTLMFASDANRTAIIEHELNALKKSIGGDSPKAMKTNKDYVFDSVRVDKKNSLGNIHREKNMSPIVEKEEDYPQTERHENSNSKATPRPEEAVEMMPSKTSRRRVICYAAIGILVGAILVGAGAIAAASIMKAKSNTSIALSPIATLGNPVNIDSVPAVQLNYINYQVLNDKPDSY